MRCRYCIHYFEGELNKTEDERGYKKLSRTCPVISEEVTQDTKSCKEFTKVKIFYCDKDDNRLYMSVCVSRQNKNRRGCIKCKQGKIIRKIMDEG
jgi:hypothetical protein